MKKVNELTKQLIRHNWYKTIIKTINKGYDSLTPTEKWLYNENIKIKEII